VDEYRALAETHGFTREEMQALVLNAVRAAFLPSAEKEQMLRAFVDEFASLAP
jgi:adenosine deaminase